jgi:HEAT repeat protein
VLIRVLKEGAEGYVKIAAAKALARIRDARAVGPLVTSLSQAGSLWTLKAAYANALSAIGDPTSVAALQSSLKQAQEHWNDRRLQLAESDAPQNDISRQLCEQDFREVQAAINEITEALRKLGGESTGHAQSTVMEATLCKWFPIPPK